MKLLEINSVCGIGSTGKIAAQIARDHMQAGGQAVIAYGRGSVPEDLRPIAHRIGGRLDILIHAAASMFLDAHGFASKSATRSFLQFASGYDPDILWMHNLHGYYIDVEQLFAWIKSRPAMKVIWTLHDCWSFTGHCAHFAEIGCMKWKTVCADCPQKKEYPVSRFLSASTRNFERKKAAFTGVRDMTIITPSEWLASFVRQSFLGCYPVEVRHNTVDHSIFRPVASEFREKLGIGGRKLVLAVSGVWTESKGIADLLKLPDLLGAGYAVVIIGLSEKQLKELPKDIIGLPRLGSQQELAEAYSAADVLFVPSRQEVFGMTVLEAACCGTTPVVYKDTACEEVAGYCGGIAVPMKDLVAAVREIKRICSLSKKDGSISGAAS